jgi:hypothetical protein
MRARGAVVTVALLTLAACDGGPRPGPVLDLSGPAGTHERAPVPALDWRATAAAGVMWSDFALRARGEGRRTRIVVVRVEPPRVRFSLVQRTSVAARAPAWTLDDAPADAVVALNAGQFSGALPWGWLVQDGVERLPPGDGPLSSAVIVHTDGRVRIVEAGDSALAPWRGRRDLALAFQSYPTLLSGAGETPALLGAVSRTHRDARMAMGVDADGVVLIAMTRFDLLGGALDRLPLGLTTPEMARVMRGLGAQQAVMLDGGISAQLLVRGLAGEERWPGSRRVPLALLVHGRPAAP